MSWPQCGLGDHMLLSHLPENTTSSQPFTTWPSTRPPDLPFGCLWGCQDLRFATSSVWILDVFWHMLQKGVVKHIQTSSHSSSVWPILTWVICLPYEQGTHRLLTQATSLLSHL